MRPTQQPVQRASQQPILRSNEGAVPHGAAPRGAAPRPTILPRTLHAKLRASWGSILRAPAARRVLGRIPVLGLAAFLALLAAAPADASGILAPTDATLPPLRITDHLVSATVRDGVAVTKLTQVFRNDTGRRLEATYVFPLPEAADLTDFRMSFNGKMVEGEVLPADEAAAIYESIVRQARDPGIIEFIGRRLLRMRVFPIEPESDTTIEVRYQQICRPLSGMTAYHYPLRTSQTSGQAHGTVRFAVELETSAPLKAIWSPTHAVEVVRDADEHAARIAYEATGGSLEDDFMLLYDTDGADVGLSCVAHMAPSTAADASAGRREGHFVLMLTPKQLWTEASYQPQDVVFVVDTSGSMAGEKLAQAQAALQYSIDRLDERDRFSIVRFSTGFDALFDGLRPAVAAARAEAKTWVGQMQAAGGTNIADTLAHVMGMLESRDGADDRPFVVVFLTDGRGNREPAEILNLLVDADHGAKAVRFFPFGVGHDVNTQLLDRLPEQWSGRTTYVQPGENLEFVLGDFFSVVSRPVLTDLRLTLPDIGASDRFPVSLGDLYHRQQLVVAGRFAREAEGPVTLAAMRGGERVEFVWPKVAFRHVEGTDAVPSVWAGRKIAYLLGEIRRHGESQEMVDEILALSMAHGIQTPYSSWLVAPEGRPQPMTVGGRRGLMGGAPAGSGFGGAPGAPSTTTAVRARIGRAVAGAGGGGISAHDLASAAELRPEDLMFAGLEADAIDGALVAESGAAAVALAQKNAEMKDLRSRDESRLRREALAWREIEGVVYHRIGRFLVDERFVEDAQVIVIAVASDAWFELLRGHPELRPALAASRDIVVVPVEGVAVLVSSQAGAEAFTDEQRAQLGLGAG